LAGRERIKVVSYD
jgi:hypothetical protein